MWRSSINKGLKRSRHNWHCEGGGSTTRRLISSVLALPLGRSEDPYFERNAGSIRTRIGTRIGKKEHADADEFVPCRFTQREYADTD